MDPFLAITHNVLPLIQELTEQHNRGVNADYGLPTPTLVSPPKALRPGMQHVKSAPSNLEIAVLKTYPFDSAVQRMTVVTKKKGAPQFDVYVKGAPEKVASLCKPETSEEMKGGKLQASSKTESGSGFFSKVTTKNVGIPNFLKYSVLLLSAFVKK